MESKHCGARKLTRRSYVALGLLTFGVWTLILGLSSTDTPALNIAVAALAAVVQLRYAHRAHDAGFVATRAYESSTLWIAAVVGAASAALVERVLVADVATWAIIGAAFSTALMHAVFQEVRAARQTVHHGHQQRAVIIGTGEAAGEWFALASDHPDMGIELVGCVGDRDNAVRGGMERMWLGGIDDLEDILHREEVELPIIAVTSFRRPTLQKLINRLSAADYDIAIWWGVGRFSTARLSWRTMSHEAMPMIRAHNRSRAAVIADRTFDIVGASLLLVLFSPILLIGAIGVRLDSSGPAFFRQRRVGLDSRPFDMIKLRTMDVDAEACVADLSAENERGEGVLFKMKNDPRVTKVGRILRATSIDEVPQLLNVIRGEMSLVGPRPALVTETEKFDEELARRNTVRPGITGLWQLESRANPSFHAYKRLDLHYLENWSLALDLRIAIATAQLLVLGVLVHPIVRRFSAIAEPPEVVEATPAKPQHLDEPELVIDLRTSSRRIAVLGAGYVGLTQALGLADLGHEVTCADINKDRIAALIDGKPPILEEGLEELLHNCQEAGNLLFTSDPLAACVDADFVFLCVATPQGPDGAADLSYLDAAARQIGPVLQAHTIVVNKSTVPVGSTVRVAKELGRSALLVVSNPEFLREGTAISDWKSPDRIVVGGDALASNAVLDLYAALPGERVSCDASSAELIKYASNAYLATRLTFVNSISEVCDAVGADVLAVTAAMGLDGRIGPRYLEPGPGWGGSCLPKDTHALAFQADDAGVNFRQLRATIEANDAHIDRAARLVLDALPGGAGTVGVLGIAFKAGTGDIRDSPAIKVMNRLIAAGVTVRAFDPAVSELPGSEILVVNNGVDAARDADVLLVATEWPEFRDLDLEKMAEVMRTKSIVDVRNHLDPLLLAPLGFEYVTHGSRKLSAVV